MLLEFSKFVGFVCFIYRVCVSDSGKDILECDPGLYMKYNRIKQSGSR